MVLLQCEGVVVAEIHCPRVYQHFPKQHCHALPNSIAGCCKSNEAMHSFLNFPLSTREFKQGLEPGVACHPWAASQGAPFCFGVSTLLWCEEAVGLNPGWPASPALRGLLWQPFLFWCCGGFKPGPVGEHVLKQSRLNTSFSLCLICKMASYRLPSLNWAKNGCLNQWRECSEPIRSSLGNLGTSAWFFYHGCLNRRFKANEFKQVSKQLPSPLARGYPLPGLESALEPNRRNCFPRSLDVVNVWIVSHAFVVF